MSNEISENTAELCDRKKSDIDGIVLLAKKPGLTSFSSLGIVKKALGTTKVGHTGTLDSFASGLLVVCTGRLTKLAGKITEFDKTYEAVIHFGAETDTCEYTGNVIRTAPLPTEEDFFAAVKKWTGEIDQKPPLFSAIHIDGKRASDLARLGKSVEIPARKVTVFSAEIKELKYAGAEKNHSVSGDFFPKEPRRVEYAHIVFSVSKGTYIRSLARDIAESCGSAAHLTGLYRTKVGNFRIEDAAGYDSSDIFNIESAITTESDFKNRKSCDDGSEANAENNVENDLNGQNDVNEKNYLNGKNKLCAKNREREKNVTHGKKTKERFSAGMNFFENENAEKMRAEIIRKKKPLSVEMAKLCGFEIAFLKNDVALECFKNGKPLRSELFKESLWDYPKNSEIAVFCDATSQNVNADRDAQIKSEDSEKEDSVFDGYAFVGLIQKNTEGRIKYGFVMN